MRPIISKADAIVFLDNQIQYFEECILLCGKHDRDFFHVCRDKMLLMQNSIQLNNEFYEEFFKGKTEEEIKAWIEEEAKQWMIYP